MLGAVEASDEGALVAAGDCVSARLTAVDLAPSVSDSPTLAAAGLEAEQARKLAGGAAEGTPVGVKVSGPDVDGEDMWDSLAAGVSSEEAVPDPEAADSDPLSVSEEPSESPNISTDPLAADPGLGRLPLLWV